MIKTGIILSISNKKASVMTNSGEFVYIKISKPLPNVGEIYTGELYKKNLFNYKYAITAASLMFILFSSGYAYSYYTPITTIVLSINPSVSLNANRWNKIISSKALNSDGSLILSNIKLKNKSIDTALELLVKEAKSKNFINYKYINDKKVVNVNIKSNKNESIDISNLKNVIDSNNLKMKINTSSGNNKTINITVNNKKFNTSSLDSISNKREVPNKDLDNNNKINNKKLSNLKEKNQSSIKPTISKNNNIKKVVKSQNKILNNNNSYTINKYNNLNESKDYMHGNKNKNHSYGKQDKKNSGINSDINSRFHKTNTMVDKIFKHSNH